MGIPGCALSAVRAGAMLLITTWLVLAMAMPVLAGKQTCSLQATVGGGSATEVEVGEEVLIEGFGFPAMLDVEITYAVEGAAIGTVTVTTDATGVFEATVTPTAAQVGLWTVTATDIEDICTDDTGFLVVGAPSTVTPSPSPAIPSPAASQLPNAAADEPTGATSGVVPALLVAAFLLAGAVWTFARRAVARSLR